MCIRDSYYWVYCLCDLLTIWVTCNQAVTAFRLYSSVVCSVFLTCCSLNISRIALNCVFPLTRFCLRLLDSRPFTARPTDSGRDILGREFPAISTRPQRLNNGLRQLALETDNHERIKGREIPVLSFWNLFRVALHDSPAKILSTKLSGIWKSNRKYHQNWMKRNYGSSERRLLGSGFRAQSKFDE